MLRRINWEINPDNIGDTLWFTSVYIDGLVEILAGADAHAKCSLFAVERAHVRWHKVLRRLARRRVKSPVYGNAANQIAAAVGLLFHVLNRDKTLVTQVVANSASPEAVLFLKAGALIAINLAFCAKFLVQLHGAFRLEDYPNRIRLHDMSRWDDEVRCFDAKRSHDYIFFLRHVGVLERTRSLH